MTFSGPFSLGHAVIGLHVEVMGDEAVKFFRGVSLTLLSLHIVSC